MLNPLGLDVVRFQPSSGFAARRQEILRAERVDVALDVGAHVGSYARQLRLSGFRGRIVCFEPLAEAFAQLRSEAAGDERWECRQLALGREDGRRELRVSRNVVSSSFLEPTDRLAEAAPRAVPGRTEAVEAARLDSLRRPLLDAAERVFLKADVQGLELEVLAGADETLRQVRAVELELTLLPLYEGQPLATEAIAYLDERGYDLLALAEGFRHERTGQLLQLDALFVRRQG